MTEVLPFAPEAAPQPASRRARAIQTGIVLIVTRTITIII
jgi:hypothetical protein